MRLDGDVQDIDSVSDDDTNDLYNSVIDFPDTCQASARYTGPRKLLEQAAQDTRYSSKYHRSHSFKGGGTSSHVRQFDNLRQHRSAVNAEGIPNYGLTFPNYEEGPCLELGELVRCWSISHALHS
ncbi:hypothetical protein HO173_009679 [Letharia columbiana]|uniref:Uncharacterized protein n=1 Tax=Letharia columbiana TaxID=112416 RepID=A0A8H6L1L2_9LECA|nr:uncharacterized protein HO173_009679 [Letharia columbiana]KAF6232085.1 hypothetical protein HO173_009679 [Letharia columbiana]